MLESQEHSAVGEEAVVPVRSSLVSTGAEIAFGQDEIFFSRTDLRGVIASGNAVFERVSGYCWSELIGAPHKMIRHDDMPKAVFHMFWDHLKNDRPVVAFVKNRSKCGGYYWVLAFATPTDGGYLSVRIKPRSELLKVAQQEYAYLRNREKSENLSAEDSAAIFLERLAGLGYSDYDSFAAIAAAKEVSTLLDTLGKKCDYDLAAFRGIQQALYNVRIASEKVADSCGTVDVLPMNLQIQSARSGAVAAPIGIVAQECSQRTIQLMNEMYALAQSTKSAYQSVNGAVLRIAISQVQSVAATEFLEQDECDTTFDREVEENRLKSVNRGNGPLIHQRLQLLRAEVGRCSEAAKSIRQHVIALDVTRSMCEIENRGTGPEAKTIATIISQLSDFQKTVPALLREISTNLEQARDRVDKILKQQLEANKKMGPD